jgi:NAD(P)-dependent dehydrogenase (short-subunit alcohol dehydrogenase family)
VDDLRGANALLTGAAGGLGRHIARTLAANGVRIAASGRNGDSLELPLPQRAAEVLTGISSQLARGERSAMDRLLSLWLSDQYTDADRPDSWYTLKYVLAEAFQALELSRMVFRIDETPQGGTVCYYAISSDGAAALERGDVAEVVKRRLPD